jgi:hypothetical protein
MKYLQLDFEMSSPEVTSILPSHCQPVLKKANIKTTQTINVSQNSYILPHFLPQLYHMVK